MRTPELYAAGHIDTAVDLPYRRINSVISLNFPPTRYSRSIAADPCSAADRAAAHCRLGRKVKKMIGGIAGWKDDGFDLVTERIEETT